MKMMSFDSPGSAAFVLAFLASCAIGAIAPPLAMAGPTPPGKAAPQPGCPDGLVRKKERCEPAACRAGMVRAGDKVHCCWPGQSWSAARKACAGAPKKCPEGFSVDAQAQTCSAPACTATSGRDARGTCVGLVEMVAIPAATFEMGDSTSGPVHRVTLSPYSMDRTEVTVGQYRACLKAGACSAPATVTDCNWGKPGREEHPINCVDSEQAKAFCAWAGKRLPTEAEWEYAARGSDGRGLPWGDEAPGAQLCWKRSEGTCPVGSIPWSVSAFNLLDMAGNTWEWVADWYAAYSPEPARDPQGPASTNVRVVRGGCWHTFNPSFVRATHRERFNPTEPYGGVGFRCARSGK